MKSFAIAGHCNTASKIQHVLGLIEYLRQHWPNCYIVYASHVSISQKIQEVCDACLYDNNNPIGNIDFENRHTKQYVHYFWGLPQPKFDVIKTIPYHHFAHHLSNYLLTQHLVSLPYIDTITYLTYDCDYEVVEHVHKHYDLLVDYDAIFYDFFTPGKSVNTDFFTFRVNTAKQTLLKVNDSSKFFSFDYKEIFTIEQIYHALMEREEVNFHVLKKWHKNLGRVGTMKQNDRSEVTVGPLDPQHEDLQMCPFYDWSENKIKIVLFMFHHDPQDPYEIKLEYFDEDNRQSDFMVKHVLPHNHWMLTEPPAGYIYCKVSRDGNPSFMFDLSDSNNFGIMKRKI